MPVTPRFSGPATWLEQAAARWPDAPFLDDGTTRLSYAAAARRSAELAGWLQELGLRKGDCPPTEERLAAVVQAGTELLQNIETSNE